MESQTKKASGLAGTSSFYFISKHFQKALVILPSSTSLEEAKNALEFYSQNNSKILVFPKFMTGYELLRDDPQIHYERLKTQLALSGAKTFSQTFILTNSIALSQKVLPLKELLASVFEIEKGESFDRDEFIQRLKAAGYTQDELAQDDGFFSVRGHLIDVFSPYEPEPSRIEFFGDEIVSIRNFDPESQRSLNEIRSVRILPCRELQLSQKNLESARKKLKELGDARNIDRDDREQILWQLKNQREVIESRWLLPAFSSNLCNLTDYLPQNFPTIVANPEQCESELKKSLERDALRYQELDKLAFAPKELRTDLKDELQNNSAQLWTEIHPSETPYQVLTYELLRPQLLKEKNFNPLIKIIQELRDQNQQVGLIFKNKKKMEALREALGEVSEQVDWHPGKSFSGFSSKTFQKCFLNEKDIFGSKKTRPSTLNLNPTDFLREFSDLKDGDYVVHEDHGIGKYHGLIRLSIGQVTSEFVHIEYADKDKLYLPIYRLEKISRYVAGDGLTHPRLDRLGSNVFSKKRAKAREDILKIAHELIEVAAKREVHRVLRKTPDESVYQDFCLSFSYDLTPDQERSVKEIEQDLCRTRPMDRLICGDVGFGKTEVAMRATLFRALQSVQVAILAPTTLLVEQHYQTFKKRLIGLPFRVERLSRFIKPNDQKKIIEDLAKGKIQIIIGTHRLLQRDVHFQNLGMLVVDEEQRFGVRHKEKIKKLKAQIDVLSLSATPIPRTLQMAMVGIRDLSLIVTPPEEREAVDTKVGSFDKKLIDDVCKRELDRGGQILFVHNRVKSIQKLKERLQEILPKFRIAVGHGQMKETELERVMKDFINRKYDVLLATSIIENGLDLSNANTLLVDHAEQFGLSDLYQLRGRVGRSNRKAYAYFLIHEETPLSAEASKRLQVIQSCTELGSGFRVATHDLEIRGAGNLLGEAQSGIVAEVGLEFYNQMLHESLAEIRKEKISTPLPELNSGYTAYIPENYIPDAPVRISSYRRLNRASSLEELLNLEDELLDRFGLYPPEVENYCQLIHLKMLAADLKAKTIDCYPGKLALEFFNDTPLDPDTVISLLSKKIQLDPKGRITFYFASKLKAESPGSSDKRPEMIDFEICRDFLNRLAKQSSSPSKTNAL